MKNITTRILFYASLVAPWIAFAHGGVDDGDVEEVATLHPEQRMKVLAVVVVVAALIGGFMWHARRKNMPAQSQNDGGEQKS